MQIMEAAALEEGTRVLAAEFLVTLCESRDKVLKKQPQLGQPFFTALLQFLLDVEVRCSLHVTSVLNKAMHASV